jgi:hypothetical protein
MSETATFLLHLPQGEPVNFIASSITFLVAIGAVAAAGLAVYQDYEGREDGDKYWFWQDWIDAVVKISLFIGGLAVFHTWLRVVF